MQNASITPNLKIYLDLFQGREDRFAFQGPDFYIPVKKTFDTYYLTRHLEGIATFGIYVLNSESKCNFFCIDIDIPKNELENTDFSTPSAKYNALKVKFLTLRSKLRESFQLKDEQLLFEDTGGRGLHIWVFFENAIPAEKIFKLNLVLKKSVEFDYEYFPKQAKLTEKRKLGNLIKLPLGEHRKYNNKSVFFKLNGDEPEYYDSLDENINHLGKVARVFESHIEKLLEDNVEVVKSPLLEGSDHNEAKASTKRVIFKKDIPFLFKRCNALRNLSEKATQNVKFSRSEAFHFANQLLSVRGGEEVLKDYLKKSFGMDYDENITKREIDAITPLCPATCDKLISSGICQEYCTPDIKSKNEDPLLPNSTPVSYWLVPTPSNKLPDKSELLNQIADLDNLRSVYWQLKKYHGEEDGLFYDVFDFELFEDMLEENLQVIRHKFIKKDSFPFLGFLNFKIPKKIGGDNELVYRQLAYASIHDLIIVQAVFQQIGKFIESDFCDSSFGYRLASGTDKSLIFKDWREYYPKFKSAIDENLRNPKAKYYICCDIKEFYDNVQHDILIEQLRTYIDEPYLMQLVKDTIHLYKFTPEENRGVPQGPAYARVLANLYLNNFDKEVSKKTLGYFRYVDDIFMFFESKEDAEECLKFVYTELDQLNLELPQEDEKKPEISSTSKETKIQERLDAIQYGIFEEFKFIRYFEYQEIDAFYEAVEKHAVPSNKEDIVNVNSKLPSILYLIANDNADAQALRKKIPSVVEYLAEKGLFFPKRLKYIFYPLIDLYKDQDKSIVDLFNKLDVSHKVYLLLSLYSKYLRDNSFKAELSNVLSGCLSDSSPYLEGFALQILKRTRISEIDELIDLPKFKNILKSDNYFVRSKLFEGFTRIFESDISGIFPRAL